MPYRLIEACKAWLEARGYTVLEPNPEGGWSYERRQAVVQAMAEFCDNCQERHLCHDVADCDFVARTDEDAPRPVTASEDHGDDPAPSREDRIDLSAAPEPFRAGPGVAGAPQGYCNLHDGPCSTCPRDKTRDCPSPF